MPPSFGPYHSSTPGHSLPESTLRSGILETGQSHLTQASFVCTGLPLSYWSVHAVARRASTRTFQQLSALVWWDWQIDYGLTCRRQWRISSLRQRRNTVHVVCLLPILCLWCINILFPYGHIVGTRPTHPRPHPTCRQSTNL